MNNHGYRFGGIQAKRVTVSITAIAEPGDAHRDVRVGQVARVVGRGLDEITLVAAAGNDGRAAQPGKNVPCKHWLKSEV